MNGSMMRWTPVLSAAAVWVMTSTALRAQVRQGTVTAQTLQVYAEMSADSDQVTTLAHGAAVQILFSVATGDGNWCSVANANSSTKLGYVDCQGLAIQTTGGTAAAVGASSTGAAGMLPTVEQKEWALAASDMIATFNHESLNTLAEGTPASARHILDYWWSIRSRDDLFNVLSWLESGGERQEFSVLGARATTLSDADLKKVLSRMGSEGANAVMLARKYYPRYQNQSVAGFDYARYINLCRWGVTAGYMTPDEAWPRIMTAARALQQNFGSWTDMGKNYLVGREFWSLKQTRIDGARMRATYEWLISTPSSPWRRIPWDLPLQ